MSKEIKMKKCKECGEMFLPKSPKQKYCDKDHYRPCPVCSKLVFAKYLSDPARCCSGKCQYQFGLQNKNKRPNDAQYVESVESSVVKSEEAKGESITRTKDGIDVANVRKYTGSNSCGFVEGHLYEVNIKELGRGSYSVDATYDVTDEAEVEMSMPMTNKKLIAKMFKSVKTL